MLPADAKAHAHCRAISGEMHSGFSALRGALPMNIKAHHPGFKVWSRAQADIDRVLAIWKECLGTYGGPFLFGEQPCIADAMYAPVVTRFLSYDVPLDRNSVAYCKRVMELPAMKEWLAATGPSAIAPYPFDTFQNTGVAPFRTPVRFFRYAAGGKY